MDMEVPNLITFGEVALDIILAGVDEVPRRWAVLGHAREARAVTAGTAGYVAQCFSKLGGRASVIGKIGDDNVGKLVLDGFHRCAVSTKNLIVDDNANTEISTVILYNDGNKSSVVSEILPLTPEDAGNSLTSGKAFHFAGFLLYPKIWGKRAISLFKRVRKSSLFVSADPQMSATGVWAKPFEGILEHLDVLLLDEEEARRISRRERTLDAVDKLLLTNGPRIVAVKLGAKGCIVGYADRIRHIRAYKVTPVSTIGAGDAFDAAFIFGSLKNWSVEKTGRFANVAAAISTTQYGCMTAIPRAKTVEKLSRAYYGD